MSQSHSDAVPPKARSDLSRLLLQVDGLAVATGGVLLAAGARPLASILGAGVSWPLVALGAAFIPYGTWLVWQGTRVPDVRIRNLARGIAVANAAWVVLSLAALIAQTPGLSATGRWIVGTQAGLVGLLAAAEAFASRRSTDGSTAATTAVN